MTPVTPPVVLTIAGTDPSGGAGIQADLKTFTSLKCYGTSVVTALVAQNTLGVRAVHPSPPDFVQQQLDSVLEDMAVDAFKTGMLHSVDIINTVSVTLRKANSAGKRHLLVVDPVCVSTSGHRLLEAEAVGSLISELMPLATVITPNKSEAELLLTKASEAEVSINNLHDAIEAAVKLTTLGECSVLLKGGHLVTSPEEISHVRANNRDVHIKTTLSSSYETIEILNVGQPSSSKDTRLVVDILCEPGSSKTHLFVRPRIDSTNTHGTGCTLSAALTCYLAMGYSVTDAVQEAINYTYLAIQTAFPLGKGHGPLNHLHRIQSRTVPQSSAVNLYPFTRLLIESNIAIWKEYVQHSFVRQLGAGSLPREQFLHFIKQDYKYLQYYSRVFGLLIAKAQSFSRIKSYVRTILNVLHEVGTHKAFCSEWGVDEAELEGTPESAATTAYGAYLLDVGLHGDEAKLVIAVGACLLGYGEVGLWLISEARRPGSWVKLEGNPYLRWIQDYSGEGYQEAVKLGIRMLEDQASDDIPSMKRLEEWVQAWERCTQLEKGFWDMALTLS